MKKEIYNYQLNKKYSLQKINIYAYSFFATQILEKKKIDEFIIDIDSIIANISNSINNQDEDLNQLREKNHINFYKLDTKFLEDVDDRYKRFSVKILKEYKSIHPSSLLVEDKQNALTHFDEIDVIAKKIDLLKEKVREDLLTILDYVDKDEQEINLSFLNDDNKSAKILKQKYNTILLQKQVMHLDNINLEIERQKNRLSLIRQLIPLSKRYAEKRPAYLKQKYNKENTVQFRENLSIIICEYIFLLTRQEFHDVRKVYEGMLKDDYSYVYEFLYTYKIILNKVWKYSLTDINKRTKDYCYLVSYSDVILNSTKLEILNNKNVELFGDSGYICDYNGDLFEMFNISEDDIISLKLPTLIDTRIKFKVINTKGIEVIGRYNKTDEPIKNSKYPVVDIDGRKE